MYSLRKVYLRRRLADALAWTHLVVDQCSERQVIKQVRKELPNIRIPILSQTFVVESIDLRDLSRFVVPTEYRHSVAVPHLESDQQRNSLNGIVTSVYVVAHEEVVCIWRISADTKQLRKVVLCLSASQNSRE